MKTIKLGLIETTLKNFEAVRNWEEADALCKRLGPGWRLPSLAELSFLYNFYELGVLSLDDPSEEFMGYWSNSLGGDDETGEFYNCEIYYFRTYSGGDPDIVWEDAQDSAAYEVRPVRSI